MAKTRKKKTKKKKKRASIPVQAFFWFLGTMFLLACIGAAAIVGIFYYYGSDPDMPRLGSIHDYAPKATTRILDRQGILIGEISAERRTVVPFEKIPKVLIQAVVAAEDADFFKHEGLDYMGMFRAFVANVRAGRFVQGGSTITQQVVKTFFLSPEKKIKRKIQEVILAKRLETELSKNEILTLYLNQIYFGHGRYGVQEASRFFFHKSVNKLGVPEAAMLAGLPKSPNRLSPLRHPKRAKARQIYVLGEMVKCGFLEDSKAKGFMDKPIRVVRNKRPYYNEAAEITDFVRAHLVEKLGEKKLVTWGKDVVTTLDVKMHLQAKEALQWGLRAIDGRQGYRGPIKHIKKKDMQKVLTKLKKSNAKMMEGEYYEAIVTKVNDKKKMLTVDLGTGDDVKIGCDSERYNPENHAPSKTFKPGDLVKIRAVRDGFVFEGGPQGAIVVMDPKNGNVLAMVGGYDVTPGQLNRVIRAKRQPGSAFKPFVYGAALDSGKYTAATIVDDAPVVFKKWIPRNYDGKYRGPVRLRTGLARSINAVAAKVINDVGVDTVRTLAINMGITTPLGHDLSLALGSSGVIPLDLATAFCAIANGGKKVNPKYVLKEDSKRVSSKPKGDEDKKNKEVGKIEPAKEGDHNVRRRPEPGFLACLKGHARLFLGDVFV